jgi:hypothetical protein
VQDTTFSSLTNSTSALCRLSATGWEPQIAQAARLGFDAIVLQPTQEFVAEACLESAAANHLSVFIDIAPENAEHMLTSWCKPGIGGFCCRFAHHVPPSTWTNLIAQVRSVLTGVRFAAFTHGASPEAITALKPCGFDIAVSSSCWWDF